MEIPKIDLNLSRKTIKGVFRFPYLPNVLQKAYFKLFLKPQRLIIHPNTQCNYNCIYCYSDSDAKEGLTTNDWFKVIDEAKEIGIKGIIFSGGEPLLHPDLYSLLRYVVKKICKFGYLQMDHR